MTHVVGHIPERHRRFPAIPDPQPTVESLVQVCNALKEAVELITDQRRRGQELVSSPTWGDLVHMGMIAEDQVPKGGVVEGRK